MKKIPILALAAISAFVCMEFFVAKIIGYPKYGVEMKILGLRGLSQGEYIYKPFSEYWTVEGGNRVYHRNNIGLPGINVRVAGHSRYIFVLGSSIVEAAQLPPDKIAVSLLQDRLRLSYPLFQAINLGAAGHDAYELFWRANYFEINYPPAFVFLVVEALNSKWLASHQQPLNFDTKGNVPKLIHSKVTDFARLVVNQSSFFNLLYSFLRNEANDAQVQAQAVPLVNDNHKETGRKMEAVFFDCLKKFKLKYGERFFVISILNEDDLNSRMKSFCESNGIRIVKRKIFKRENRIAGKGHLNAKGNLLFAELLYEAFIKYQK